MPQSTQHLVGQLVTDHFGHAHGTNLTQKTALDLSAILHYGISAHLSFLRGIDHVKRFCLSDVGYYCLSQTVLRLCEVFLNFTFAKLYARSLQNYLYKNIRLVKTAVENCRGHIIINKKCIYMQATLYDMSTALDLNVLIIISIRYSLYKERVLKSQN